MPIGSGPASSFDARGVGAYFDSLIRDPSWLLRRVETIRILDDARVERSITLDIDVAAARARPGFSRVKDAGYFPIPIAVLTKDLLFELDVRDSAGAALSVAVSDSDSHATHALLIKRLHSTGVSRRAVTSTLLSELFTLVRYPGVPKLVGLLRQTFPEDAAASAVGAESGAWVEPRNLIAWRTALEDAEFFETVATFAESYILIAFVPLIGNAQIVKVRHVEPSLVRVRPFNLAHLGLAPLKMLLEVPGIGTAQREHIRVIAPNGSTVQDVELLQDGQPLPADDYAKRVSLERGIVYTRDLGRGSYDLSVKLNMRRGGLLLPAAISTAFMLLLLGFGTFLEVEDQRLSSGDASADAAVTILALLPTIGSIYFVQPGEHGLVRRILGVPRIAVVASSLATVFVAAGVAASVQPESLLVLMTTALIATSLTFVLLLASLIRITAHRAPVSDEGTPF